jgi:glycine/D-amino acid oxidase-like deaminating enzyme
MRSLEFEDFEERGRMKEADFLIAGAGIRGTSCGHRLLQDHSVIVLEMESQLGWEQTFATERPPSWSFFRSPPRSRHNIRVH